MAVMAEWPGKHWKNWLKFCDPIIRLCIIHVFGPGDLRTQFVPIDFVQFTSDKGVVKYHEAYEDVIEHSKCNKKSVEGVFHDSA